MTFSGCYILPCSSQEGTREINLNCSLVRVREDFLRGHKLVRCLFLYHMLFFYLLLSRGIECPKANHNNINLPNCTSSSLVGKEWNGCWVTSHNVYNNGINEERDDREIDVEWRHWRSSRTTLLPEIETIQAKQNSEDKRGEMTNQKCCCLVSKLCLTLLQPHGL